MDTTTFEKQQASFENGVPLEPVSKAHRSSAEWVGPRVVRCPMTGYSVVAARPGVRKITSEEIYEWLRQEFP